MQSVKMSLVIGLVLISSVSWAKGRSSTSSTTTTTTTTTTATTTATLNSPYSSLFTFSVGGGYFPTAFDSNHWSVDSTYSPQIMPDQLGCFYTSGQSLNEYYYYYGYNASDSSMNGSLAPGGTMTVTFNVCNGSGLAPVINIGVWSSSSAVDVHAVSPSGAIINASVQFTSVSSRPKATYYVYALGQGPNVLYDQSISAGTAPRSAPGQWTLVLKNTTGSTIAVPTISVTVGSAFSGK